MKSGEKKQAGLVYKKYNQYRILQFTYILLCI